MDKYYVYIHRKEDTGEVFYVGKGTKNRAFKTYGRSSYWKNIVAKHGFIAEIVTDLIDEELAFLIECEMIDTLTKRGATLCNLTNGGEGSSGYKHTQEALKKISATQKGISKPDSQKEKLSALLKSGNHPIFSEASREKNRGVNHRAYGKEHPNKGKHIWGEEDKKRLSEQAINQIRKPLSDEAKQNIRQAKLGKKVEDTSKFHWEREVIECPHCGKSGIVSNMKRWHFDNCKMKKEAA